MKLKMPRAKIVALLGLCVTSIASAGTASADDLPPAKKSGDWSLYVDFDHGGSTKHRGAFTNELSDRAAPLVLEGCSESVDISEGNPDPFKRELSELHLIFSPDETFEVGTDQSLGSWRAWWVRVAVPGHANNIGDHQNSEASIFDPGMDGYYFSLSGILLGGHTSAVSICTSMDTNEQSCRKFSLKGFDDAVRFVCQMDID